jgi:hypothetical protein
MSDSIRRLFTAALFITIGSTFANCRSTNPVDESATLATGPDLNDQISLSLKDLSYEPQELKCHQGKSSGKVCYYKGSFPPAAPGQISVCSFNISFLGHWKKYDPTTNKGDKRNRELAQILKNCDLVSIQEMAATPVKREYDILDKSGAPGKKVMKADGDSIAFVEEMKKVGFDRHILSEEDTGPNVNRNNSTRSDWYVAFYKSSKLRQSTTLPTGYLDTELVNSYKYSRVPFAFGFDVLDDAGKKKNDFIIVSTHLFPTLAGTLMATKYTKNMETVLGTNHFPELSTEVVDGRSANWFAYSQAVRIHEFHEIQSWVRSTSNQFGENDIIIAGDVNIDNTGTSESAEQSLSEYNGFIWNKKGMMTSTLDFYNKYRIALGFKILKQPVSGYESLNALDQDKGTVLFGTNIDKSKPFDHVFYRKSTSQELEKHLNIYDLSAQFKEHKLPNGKENPLENTNLMTKVFSDHIPIQFFINVSDDDD